MQYLTKSLSATTAYKVVLFYLKIKKAIDDDLALTLYKKAWVLKFSISSVHVSNDVN